MSPASSISPPRKPVRTLAPAAPVRRARAARPAAEMPVEDDGLRRLARALMLLTVFLLGIRSTVFSGVTYGVALSLALAPLWLQALWRYWGARLLVGTGALAAVTGVWLAWAGTPARQVDHAIAAQDLALVVGAVAAVGVILWCRQIFTDTQIGVTFGLGLLANAVLNPGALTAGNPWKFGYLVPVSVLVLSLVQRSDRRGTQLLLTLLLALSCAMNDARSYFGTFLLVAVLVVWQMRPVSMSRGRAWGWTVALLGGLAVGAYYLGQSLLVDGFLGEAAQARTQEQLRASGSLILGGRPEAAASFGLLRDQPGGYGVGVVPSLHDINVAKSSMFDILSFQPDTGYVENFMFGGRFELHSTLGDLWAHFGALGVLLALIIGYHVVRGAALRITSGEASALLLFLSWWTLWNLLFSPLYSALPTLVLGLGLTLTPRGRPDPAESRPARSAGAAS
ncbi:hypothetical protein [Luteipulveratus flavus]|uniref:Uncharacterized protein n=1 Tax=Luteipulveratus flavus TaxID=3031728 RepID=A0ABT6CC55_9MICO|nr:hypothetical protein [Luteipulveratus sp. YIM 133296]MDF8266474.1 hypothetical protein [Luteipulveratus sp. YIM 133296]